MPHSTEQIRIIRDSSSAWPAIHHIRTRTYCVRSLRLLEKRPRSASSDLGEVGGNDCSPRRRQRPRTEACGTDRVRADEAPVRSHVGATDAEDRPRTVEKGRPVGGWWRLRDTMAPRQRPRRDRAAVEASALSGQLPPCSDLDTIIAAACVRHAAQSQPGNPTVGEETAPTRS